MQTKRIAATILAGTVWLPALLADQTLNRSTSNTQVIHDRLQIEAVLTLSEPVEVPARESGVLNEMLVEAGQRVAAGDMLARIDDKQARFDRTRALLELEAAEREAENDASVQVAEKAFELATQDYQRAIRLNNDRPGTVSNEEMEERRLRADAARLEIDNAKNKLEIARTTRTLKSNEVEAADYRIDRRAIVSLVPGFIDRVEANLGEWVEPGATVFRIVRDDRLFAETFVKADQVRRDLTGCGVRVTAGSVDGSQVELSGVITYFSPQVGTLDGEVRIRAELVKADKLIAAGQKVTMTIELDERPQSLP
jgi:multidrug resistance efflux pump